MRKNGNIGVRVISCLLISLMLVMLGVIAYAAENGPSRIILSWTADSATSQTFSWHDGAGLSSYVQYVPEHDYLVDGFASAAQIEAIGRNIDRVGGDYWQYEATASGLVPNSLYYYRVGSAQAWSQPQTFRTANPRSTNFSFLYMGDIQIVQDMGAEHAAWGQLLNSAYNAYPDLTFGMIGGDLVENGTNINQFSSLLSYATTAFAKIPLMPTNGNHESNFQESGKPELYLEVFALPQNGPTGLKEEFYSFDYGNCHITVLNSHVYSGEQRWMSEADFEAVKNWIRADLAASNATWKVVMLHHPAYAVANDAVSVQVKENWVPIFEEAQVDLVLEGHQHVYSRSYPLYQNQRDDNGVVYVMGVSGSKFYNTADETFAEKTIYNTSTYQVIEIDDDKMYLSTYDANNRVDFYEIRAKARINTRPVGDVNGDWLVNTADVEAVLTAILNANPFNSLMDINLDGVVDIRDAQQVLQIYLSGQ